MRYEEAMHKYSTGELPFEELMDIKAELIHEEKIECQHSLLNRRTHSGMESCGDCGAELGGAEYEPEDDQC